VMRQGQDEQGQRGDEKGERDENDCHFQSENVFENGIGEEEFAHLVSDGEEKLMDVQRITSFFVMRDWVLCGSCEWNY